MLSHVKTTISRVLAAFFVLTVCQISLASLDARAFDIVQITPEDRAINLTNAIELFPQQGEAFQVSTAPGTDGIVRRIEVRADSAEHTGDWAVFVLANTTDKQIDRLVVAPHYRLVNAGIIWPDLGSKRISRITPSEGFALDREPSDDADVFRITLNPGSVVTLVAELASNDLPQLYLWEPSAYKDTVNSFTLYKGILIGIAALLALVLTNLFIVRWTIMLPATAMLAWVVLTYISIDFGFLTQLLGLGPYELQFWRAGSEVMLAGGIIIFLFTYLSLHHWHINLSYVALAWLMGLAVLFSIIIIDPAVASGIARISFATTVMLSVALISFLGFRGSDRAIMLIPTWILLLCWLAAAGMTVLGRFDNDILQPALGGGLVLVILLISFTVMQHVFTSGTYQQGLFSDAERQSLALIGSGDMVWDWDVTRDRLTTNPDMSKTLGLSANSVHGPMRNWLPLLHPNDRDGFSTALDVMLEHRRGRLTHEFRLKALNDSYHWFSLKARPVLGTNGDVIRCVGTIQDVTGRKISENRLLSNAVRDNLTGLPNRELFVDRLATILHFGEQYPDLRPTVITIDIDDFKKVNLNIGISSGDTILLALVRRISRLLKPEDLLARLGSDQFGIILCSERNPKDVAALAEAVGDAIRAPLDFAEKVIQLTASIGMCTVVSDGAFAEDVIQDAELAMLHAKKFGGDRIEPFRPAFRSTGVNSTTLQDRMSSAIAGGEIDVHYQPIVNLETLNLVGFEALLRWHDPKRGTIPASEFIPLAEKNGQIFELGMLALQRAIEDMSAWNDMFGRLPIFVSVNLSAAQLLKTDLFDDIENQLRNSKCHPKQFKFELTETILMGNPDVALATFDKLKRLGIGLALDDYGTGYSSMSYLAQFPFDVLKIDQSIISGVSEKHAKVRHSILALAKELGLQVVAEGVETVDQASELARSGCDFGQSFLFGKAQNSDNTTKLLQERFAKR